MIMVNYELFKYGKAWDLLGKFQWKWAGGKTFAGRRSGHKDKI